VEDHQAGHSNTDESPISPTHLII